MITSNIEKNEKISTYFMFDYEFKPYLSSVTIEVNTIYTKNDSMLVYYFDDGYEIIENVESVSDEVHTAYLFDNQNRLIKTTKSFSGSASSLAEPINSQDIKESII